MRITQIVLSCILLAALSLPAMAQEAERRPVPIKIGKYTCKVSKAYKMRPCEVKFIAGRPVLELGEGHLLNIMGEFSVVDGSKNKVFLAGMIIGERPFGCFHCAPRCAEPGACACTELPAPTSEACKKTPVQIMFKKRKGKDIWVGTLHHTTYSNVYAGEGPERRVVSVERVIHPLQVTLQYVSKE